MATYCINVTNRTCTVITADGRTVSYEDYKLESGKASKKSQELKANGAQKSDDWPASIYVRNPLGCAGEWTGVVRIETTNLPKVEDGRLVANNSAFREDVKLSFPTQSEADAFLKAFPLVNLVGRSGFGSILR